MSLTHNTIVQYHFLGLLRSLSTDTHKVTNYSAALLAKKTWFKKQVKVLQGEFTLERSDRFPGPGVYCKP